MTETKHKSLNWLYGKIVGAAPHIMGRLGKTTVGSSIWLYDITAGDAAYNTGQNFLNNCSPGIAIKHALNFNNVRHGNAYGQVRIKLFERADAVFTALTKNLDHELTALGFEQTRIGNSDSAWQGTNRHGHRIYVEAFKREATIGDFNEIKIGDIGNVLSDPNAAHQIPQVIPEAISQFIANNQWFTSMDCLGCNVAGAKRLPENMLRWTQIVNEAISNKRGNHGVALATDQLTGSQWAYMTIMPRTWIGEYEKWAKKHLIATDRHGNTKPLHVTVHGTAGFDEQMTWLSTTKTQRAESAA
jgi:hypothetical protein